VDPWVSLYFIVIPPPVFWMTRRALSRPGRLPDRRILIWRMLPLVILTLAWSTQYDRGLFLDLRDHLLMSNAAGEGVSSFYYRYTLYPAEVFKPLDQRLIKMVACPDADRGLHRAELARELTRHDYLLLAVDGEADLGLTLDGDRLAFTQEGTLVLETTWERFRVDSRQVLAELSTRTDRWSRFRAVAFYGVLLAFPVTLYLLLFACLRVLAGIVAAERRADALSAAASLLIGLGLLVFFHFSRGAASQPGDLAAALTASAWQQRVAALKAIPERRLDICSYPGYGDMLGSPHPQERYWLSRALAASPNPEASAALLRLLDDPHINVRTMAFEGLAIRQERAAARQILKRLKASEEWYDQLYAYKALRALGWSQTRSH
jgi:HEAT repeats